MNFAKIRSGSLRKIWATLIFIGLITVGHLASRKASVGRTPSMLIAAFLLTIFNSIAVCKFSLYVSFVNFQLKYLEEMFLMTFEPQQRQDIVNVGVIEVAKKSAQKHLQKLNKAWSIFNKMVTAQQIGKHGIDYVGDIDGRSYDDHLRRI